MLELRENSFDAADFCTLWNAVWDGCPSREQVQLALDHSIYRAAVYDGEKIVGMARMIGDFGLCYYIKDVIVHPDYQGRGIGRMLMEALLRFIRENGVSGTEIAAELCAMPDKMPFYAKFGFRANEAQRMRLMYRAE
ncbi:MAG TPA: N-acetyltransferase [Ruminococcus sp.]|nr:N-acetyltransferase [Ruminococcus sp.]